MKNFLLLLSVALVAGSAAAQNNAGIGTTTPANKLDVVSTVSSSTGAAVHATNTGNAGSAVSGVSNAAGTYGVQGSSAVGTGLYGFSNSYTAINAAATTGTAVNAFSFGGYSIDIFGNVKLNGGDTNPADGAVLTSDASGNAVWKAKAAGFSSNTAMNTSVPISTFRKVEFSTEDFDLQNNFFPFAGTTTPATSVFTVPVAGIYHFASAVMFENLVDIQSAQIRLVKNSSSTVLANYESPAIMTGTTPRIYYAPLIIEGDFHLAAGDKIWVEVAQRNINSASIGLNNTAGRGTFSGLLKIAD